MDDHSRERWWSRFGSIVNRYVAVYNRYGLIHFVVKPAQW